MADNGGNENRGNGDGYQEVPNSVGGLLPFEAAPLVQLKRDLESLGEVGILPTTSPDHTRLNEILDGCNPLQLRYIAVRPFVRYDKDAAKQIGINPNVIAHWENRELIREAVGIVSRHSISAAQTLLQTFSLRAAFELVKELDSNRVQIRHNAAKEILNRGGLPAMQRMEFGNDPGREPLLTPDERLIALLGLVQGSQRERTGQG